MAAAKYGPPPPSPASAFRSASSVEFATTAAGEGAGGPCCMSRRGRLRSVAGLAPIYPDLTDLFAARTKLRLERAAMSAEKKLAVLDKLKLEASGLREMRLAREAALRAFTLRENA